MQDGKTDDAGAPTSTAAELARKPYVKPRLVRYGEVHALTRAGTASKNEGNPGLKRVGGSDRSLKENVARIGTHPLGIGLYLFDYKPQFRDAYGHGRQFGVMADEVARVRPEAVRRDASGHDIVDYGALSIVAFGQRNLASE